MFQLLFILLLSCAHTNNALAPTSDLVSWQSQAYATGHFTSEETVSYQYRGCYQLVLGWQGYVIHPVHKSRQNECQDAPLKKTGAAFKSRDDTKWNTGSNNGRVSITAPIPEGVYILAGQGTIELQGPTDPNQGSTMSFESFIQYASELP